MERPKWPNLGDHPIVIIIIVLASLIPIVTFCSGRQDLQSLLFDASPTSSPDSISPSSTPNTEELEPDSFSPDSSLLPFEIGRSLQKRPIEVIKIGDGNNNILLVGGLNAGFAPSTVEIATKSASYFSSIMEEIPDDITLHFVLSANPDSPYAPGKLEGRLNANGVDLNRNWDCRWEENASWHDSVIPGSGGLFPFSELETKSLLAYIREKQPVAVIFWGAAYRDPLSGNGMVSVGACDTRTKVSNPLALSYSHAAGYNKGDFEQNVEYTLNGDAANSLDDMGIPAVFVLLNDHEKVTDFDAHIQGIKAVIQMVTSE